MQKERKYAMVGGMTLDEMRQLAMLARIEFSDEELTGLAQDFDAILGYVAQVNESPISDIEIPQLQINGARADAQAYPSGQFVDKLIADAPASQDGFYKVPKIL